MTTPGDEYVRRTERRRRGEDEYDGLPPEKPIDCPGPCHRHDNVLCFERCCPECKTELSIDRMT